ncbi:MAG: HmuY family protein [Myxococcota bacterium]
MKRSGNAVRTALMIVVALSGCGDDDGGGMPTDGGMVDVDGGGMVEMDLGAPRDVPCQDESISTLGLFDTVSDALITEETPAPDFVHHIDTTAGGLSPTESYVYARFTDEGLLKVDLDDESALETPGWDIAFRRFIIRLNSGVSGPSRVAAARTEAGTTFEGLTSVPDGLTYREEAYFTDTCEYVSGGSGIGDPAVALASFWTYPGCVQMTGNVFVVRTETGRSVKLEVLSYYVEENQDRCDETGEITFPSGSGNVRIRWAFLD